MDGEYKSQEELETAVSKETEEEISNTASLDKSNTGAACFTTISYASCSDGLTRAQADKLAAKMGLSVRFYAGKSCSEITCRA